ncbi:response regulator transcription factor [Paralimibaculum aggregatum]|uniref:Response regulator transcription factor n=1 Tax=Paralimibaculum aggregatum TaxID=3036245 RepID=A0ABQ6LFN2_9RHOB|nr:response regulator transcription factor [Limibaculum sp. NKW23]GMG80844.1 response regulator transcription factor [Limibaculum sp. NKW23]
MRLLVVEDEPKLAADVVRALEGAGFVAETCADGEEAWFRCETEDYAAVVLDLGLPRLDGLSVLRRLRQAGIATPVLILTARGSWTERVDGIDAGADDYLVKPFRMEELLARLHAVLRRSAGKGASTLAIGRLTLDARQMRVSVDGTPVPLAPLEYRALAFLMYNAGRVVPAHELADHVYGVDGLREANTLEALMSRVRRKLKVEAIETRRGFGYIVPENAPGSAP